MASEVTGIIMTNSWKSLCLVLEGEADGRGLRKAMDFS